PKTIGAKQQGVALAQCGAAVGPVDCDFPSRAQGTGEDVALGMAFGVLGADQAAFYQPAHVGVIAREAADFVLANQVEAAIADMGEIELMAEQNQSGTGGSHPLKNRMLFGVIQNAGVGCG